MNYDNPNGRYNFFGNWVWICPQCGKRVRTKYQDHIITFYRGWKLLVHDKCSEWIVHAWGWRDDS